MWRVQIIVVAATCLLEASCRSTGSVNEPAPWHIAPDSAPSSASAGARPEARAADQTPDPAHAPADPLAAESAGSTAPPLQGAGRWKWRAVPYLFAANLEADLSVGSTTVSTDVSFDDLLDHLDFGGFFMMEGHGERWGFMVDTGFIDLGEEGKGSAGVSRSADLKLGLLGGAGTWRVTPTSPFDLVFGFRYVDVEQELTVGQASTDGDSQVLDAIVGGRATWPFAERWRFGLYGDVGAGDSDLTWQALANLGYDFDTWGLNLGYRILDYDIEDGDKALDLTLAGWLIGVEFRW